MFFFFRHVGAPSSKGYMVTTSMSKDSLLTGSATKNETYTPFAFYGNNVAPVILYSCRFAVELSSLLKKMGLA